MQGSRWKQVLALILFFLLGLTWSIKGPIFLRMAASSPSPEQCGPGLVYAGEPSSLQRWLIKAADLANRPEGVPKGEVEIHIDKTKLRLMLYIGGELYKTYPVAIGKPSTPSPVGEWQVINKGMKRGGPFGSRWMGLNVPWGVYGIHGTNAPGSIGTAASAGCFRMFNRDVEEIYPLVPIGTKVIVSGPLHVRPRKVYREGVTGPDVVLLQLSLRRSLFDPGMADGRYGAQTIEAVKRMQLFYGLPPTGEGDLNLQYLAGIIQQSRGER